MMYKMLKGDLRMVESQLNELSINNIIKIESVVVQGSYIYILVNMKVKKY